MPDILTKAQRSRVMAAIRGKDTKPELAVRSMAHRMGYRFRLHRRDLPGTPDLVFVRRRKVIFVHGCFWHQHPGCPHASRPATRRRFWDTKLDRNRARDIKVRRQLHRRGWGVLVIWECQLRQPEKVMQRIRRFMKS